MKKLKPLLMCIAMGAFLASCTTTSHMVTDNAVGTKVGVSKGRNWSFQEAAKNGGINKIATADFKTTFILIFPMYKVTVTGE